MENLAPIPRHRSWYGTLRQNVIVFLLLFIGLSANAAGNKVTLDVNNVTLENVLHSIEQQTSYRFFYSKETVNVDVPVSIKVQDEAVPDVLNKLLPKLNIGYVIDKQQIALNNVRPKGNDTEKSKNQTVKITGTVTDHQGDPLIGVSIIGNNGSGGVTTDIDGKYSIEVPPGLVSVIEHCGIQAFSGILRGCFYPPYTCEFHRFSASDIGESAISGSRCCYQLFCHSALTCQSSPFRCKVK